VLIDCWIVDNDGSLSIDCLNCYQKRAHVSISAENCSRLIGGNLILADEAIGALVGAASRASVIVTFAVKLPNALPFGARSAG
jgi:hypothetical protein